MNKYEYIATILEHDWEGKHFGAILHAGSPEALKDEVVHYLETEQNESDITIKYSEDRILEMCKYGTEQSGPEILEVEDRDTTFVILTNRICVTVETKVTLHKVTTLYNLDGNCQAQSSNYTDQQEARNVLKTCYDLFRQRAHCFSCEMKAQREKKRVCAAVWHNLVIPLRGNTEKG